VANAGWCSAWTAAATAGDGLGRRHNDGWAEGGKDPARWRWGRKPGRGRRRWGRAAGRVRASSEWERAAAAAPDRASRAAAAAPDRAPGRVRGQCGRAAIGGSVGEEHVHQAQVGLILASGLQKPEFRMGMCFQKILSGV